MVVHPIRNAGLQLDPSAIDNGMAAFKGTTLIRPER